MANAGILHRLPVLQYQQQIPARWDRTTQPRWHPQKKVVKGWTFNSLCKAEFAGAMTSTLASAVLPVKALRRRFRAHLLGSVVPIGILRTVVFRSPRTETRWGNTWTWYRALIPTPVGDGVEMWMTPIGNTGYYITVTFNFIEAARQKHRRLPTRPQADGRHPAIGGDPEAVTAPCSPHQRL